MSPERYPFLPPEDDPLINTPEPDFNRFTRPEEPDEEKSRFGEVVDSLKSFAKEQGEKIADVAVEKGKEVVAFGKERGGDILTNVRTSTIDALRLGIKDKFVEYHDNKSETIAAERNAFASERETLERAMKAEQAKINDLEDKLGPLSQAAKDTAAREKFKLERKIEDLQSKEDKLNSQLNYRNAKKGKWQDKRAQVAQEVADRYTDRLAPHEVRVRLTQDKLESLDMQIKEFSFQQQSAENALSELRINYAKIPDGPEKEELKERIEMIQSHISGSRESLAEARAERAKSVGKFATVSRRMDKLQDRKNEHLRITNRTEPHATVTERSYVQPNVESAYTPREEGYRDGSPRNDVEDSPDRAEELELIKKNPSEFAEEYNKMFPKGEQIDKKAFDTFLNKRTYIRTDKPMLAEEFLQAAQKYFADVVRQRKAAKNKTPLKPTLAKDLEKFLASIN